MSANYIGSELDLFAHALNWKAYWSAVLRPYIGSTILDVGAGIGGTAKAYSNLQCERYLALEPDASLASRMREEMGDGGYPANFDVAVGTTSDLRPDQQFDTILYIDVLEHIADDRDELRRASAHLVPDGRILVLAPAHQWLYSEFDKAIGHVQRYDRRSLLAAMPEGFVAERLIYLDCAGLLASLANRLLLRASSPSPGQIELWDGRLVPVSTRLDRALGYNVGKTIFASFRRLG